MAKIYFRDKAHKDFVMENLNKCRRNDCYHQAFFYVMGISEETRMNIGQMFDFKNDCIIPEGMHGGWQTSGTVKVCNLAFNLWNGFAEEGRERFCTPEEQSVLCYVQIQMMILHVIQLCMEMNSFLRQSTNYICRRRKN